MKENKNISFCDENTLVVVTQKGFLRLLYVPFQVSSNESDKHAKRFAYVEAVKQHPQDLIVYRIMGKWYKYNLFIIKAVF